VIALSAVTTRKLRGCQDIALPTFVTRAVPDPAYRGWPEYRLAVGGAWSEWPPQFIVVAKAHHARCILARTRCRTGSCCWSDGRCSLPRPIRSRCQSLRFPAGRRHRTSGSAHSEGHRGNGPPEPDPRHACPLTQDARRHEAPKTLHRNYSGGPDTKTASRICRKARCSR
jgi:hypothetical protein